MAWKADGSITPGFPMLNLAADVEVTPAIDDLDQDGDVEIMMAASDYRFHVVDLPAPYKSELIDWGMVRHDPQNSGWTRRIAPVGPDLGTVGNSARQTTGGPSGRHEPGGPAAAMVRRQPARGSLLRPREQLCSGSRRPTRRSHLHALVPRDRRRAAVQPQRVRGRRAQRDLLREHGHGPELDARSRLGLGQSRRQGFLEWRSEHRPHRRQRPRLRPRRRLRRQPGRNAIRHDRPDRLHGLQEHPPELLALARRRVARTTTPASRSPPTA